MCMGVVSFNQESRPSIENLRHCYENNKEGAGYAYIEDGKVVVEKAIPQNREDYLGRLCHKMDENNGPFLIHFRKASAGPVTVENCHPFLVQGSIAVIHNGTMWEHKGRVEDFSDTRYFSEKLLENLPPDFMDRDVMIHLLTDHVEPSRVALLRNDGLVRILNMKAWTEDERGVFWSNDNFTPKPLETIVEYVERTLPWWSSIDEPRCEFCKKRLNSKRTNWVSCGEELAIITNGQSMRACPKCARKSQAWRDAELLKQMEEEARTVVRCRSCKEWTSTSPCSECGVPLHEGAMRWLGIFKCKACQKEPDNPSDIRAVSEVGMCMECFGNV